MAVVAVSKVAHDGYIIKGHVSDIPPADGGHSSVDGDVIGQSMYKRVTLSDADGNVLGNTDNWDHDYGLMERRSSTSKYYYLQDEVGNLFRVKEMYEGAAEYTDKDGVIKVGVHTVGLVLQPVNDEGVNLPGIGTITTYVPDGAYNNSPFVQNGNLASIKINWMRKTNVTGNLKTTNPDGPPIIRWCFVTGANILTDAGYALVETLKVGDLIWTASHGFQPIKWIGRSVLDAIDLSFNPKLRPVFISKGALGGGLPESDLRVSRQHRMLLSSDLVNSICNEKEVLVAAIKLTDHPKIYVDEDIKTVEYFHILFDDHQIIKADGALTESLYIGEEVMKTMTPEAYAEIIALFPEIGDVNYKPLSARTILDGKMRKNLIAKHLEVEADFV